MSDVWDGLILAAVLAIAALQYLAADRAKT
jgi:hypothetical protein